MYDRGLQGRRLIYLKNVNRTDLWIHLKNVSLMVMRQWKVKKKTVTDLIAALDVSKGVAVVLKNTGFVISTFSFTKERIQRSCVSVLCQYKRKNLCPKTSTLCCVSSTLTDDAACLPIFQHLYSTIARSEVRRKEGREEGGVRRRRPWRPSCGRSARRTRGRCPRPPSCSRTWPSHL